MVLGLTQRYYGGKIQLADRIAEALERIAGGRTYSAYIEPFCGMCSVMHALRARGVLKARTWIASDAHDCVIAFWKRLAHTSWVPPLWVDRPTYDRLRASARPSALRAYAGFFWSFNGRFFQGYTTDSQKPTPEGVAALKAKGRVLRDVRFESADYRSYAGRRGCFVYLDPPYKTRTSDFVASDLSRMGFDHAEFWDFARRLSAHNVVVVSEYTAPRDFKCVATVGTTTGRAQRREKLFMYSPKPAK